MFTKEFMKQSFRFSFMYKFRRVIAPLDGRTPTQSKTSAEIVSFSLSIINAIISSKMDKVTNRRYQLLNESRLGSRIKSPKISNEE